MSRQDLHQLTDYRCSHQSGCIIVSREMDVPNIRLSDDLSVSLIVGMRSSCGIQLFRIGLETLIPLRRCNVRREVHPHTRAHVARQPISLHGSIGVALCLPYIQYGIVQYEPNGSRVTAISWTHAFRAKLGETNDIKGGPMPRWSTQCLQPGSG